MMDWVNSVKKRVVFSIQYRNNNPIAANTCCTTIKSATVLEECVYLLIEPVVIRDADYGTKLDALLILGNACLASAKNSNDTIDSGVLELFEGCVLTVTD